MQCINLNINNQNENSAIEHMNDDYSLHIQSAWRISSPDNIILGYDDLFEPFDKDQEKYDPNFDCLKFNVNILDNAFTKLLQDIPMVIADIKLDTYGGLTIVFDGEFTLEIFPTQSFSHNDKEFWRIISLNTPKLHLVSFTEGFELN